MGVSHDERTGSALRQSPDNLRTRVTSDGQTRLRSSGNKLNASHAHGIPICSSAVMIEITWREVSRADARGRQTGATGTDAQTRVIHSTQTCNTIAGIGGRYDRTTANEVVATRPTTRIQHTEDHMRSDDLESVALTLVTEGKGILAADESIP